MAPIATPMLNLYGVATLKHKLISISISGS